MDSRGRPSAQPISFSQLPSQPSSMILFSVGFSQLNYDPSQGSAPFLHLAGDLTSTFTEKTQAHIKFLPPRSKMGLHLVSTFLVPPQLQGKQDFPALHSCSSLDAFLGLGPSNGLHKRALFWPFPSVPSKGSVETRSHAHSGPQLLPSRMCSGYWGLQNVLPNGCVHSSRASVGLSLGSMYGRPKVW